MILHFFRWFLLERSRYFAIRPCLNCRAAESGARYFAIEVVDDQTGRGVPWLIEPQRSAIPAIGPTARMIAIDDPELLDQKSSSTFAVRAMNIPSTVLITVELRWM